jgi:hypothetical protein
MSQASHVLLQARLQQKPSTQMPLVHWSCPPQVEPLLFLGRQLPLLQ